MGRAVFASQVPRSQRDRGVATVGTGGHQSSDGEVVLRLRARNEALVAERAGGSHIRGVDGGVVQVLRCGVAAALQRRHTELHIPDAHLRGMVSQ